MGIAAPVLGHLRMVHVGLLRKYHQFDLPSLSADSIAESTSIAANLFVVDEEMYENIEFGSDLSVLSFECRASNALRFPFPITPTSGPRPPNLTANAKTRTQSQLREPRLLLLYPRHHRLPRIPTLQHSRIPHTRIPQPILHTPIPAPVQNLLRPLHRNRTLPRHSPRPPQRLPHNLILPSPTPPNPAHEPDFLRLLGPKLPRAETDILNPAPAPHNLRQSTQRPYIRRQANIHLLDAEPRVPGADPHIAADGDIDAQPQAPAMYRGDGRFLAPFDAGDARLERVDVSAQLCCRSCAVESGA